MKIVFINQYFPPDSAPTGLMLEKVAGRLMADGHEVTVLCAKGGYASSGKEEDGAGRSEVEDEGVRVIRLGSTAFGRNTFAGKLADYTFFYVGVAWQLAFVRPKPDRFVALTTPPFLSILARLISKIRGGDHAHWVMDLYPDVMVAHGMLKKNTVTTNVLKSLARWGYGGKRCKIVLTLGPDMQERTAAYLSESTPRQWVPLWGTSNSSSERNHFSVGEGPKTEGQIVLMYSGNMGLGHRFGEFLEAASVAGEGFVWKFHGRGKRRPEIERFCQDNPGAPVTVGDYVPQDQLAEHLAGADVHLASLDPAWDGTMVPSKLQGIFSMGRPVIFVGSDTCSIGHWILESDGGWVVPPGDLSSLLAALNEAANPAVRVRKGQNALAFSKRRFCGETNASKISELLSYP